MFQLVEKDVCMPIFISIYSFRFENYIVAREREIMGKYITVSVEKLARGCKEEFTGRLSIVFMNWPCFIVSNFLES